MDTKETASVLDVAQEMTQQVGDVVAWLDILEVSLFGAGAKAADSAPQTVCLAGVVAQNRDAVRQVSSRLESIIARCGRTC